MPRGVRKGLAGSKSTAQNRLLSTTLVKSSASSRRMRRQNSRNTWVPRLSRFASRSQSASTAQAAKAPCSASSPVSAGSVEQICSASSKVSSAANTRFVNIRPLSESSVKPGALSKSSAALRRSSTIRWPMRVRSICCWPSPPSQPNTSGKPVSGLLGSLSQ